MKRLFLYFEFTVPRSSVIWIFFLWILKRKKKKKEICNLETEVRISGTREAMNSSLLEISFDDRKEMSVLEVELNRIKYFILIARWMQWKTKRFVMVEKWNWIEGMLLDQWNVISLELNGETLTSELNWNTLGIENWDRTQTFESEIEIELRSNWKLESN